MAATRTGLGSDVYNMGRGDSFSIQDKPESCIGAACKKLSTIGKNIKKRFTRKKSRERLLPRMNTSDLDKQLRFSDLSDYQGTPSWTDKDYDALGGRRKRRRRRTRKKKGGKRRSRKGGVWSPQKSMRLGDLENTFGELWDEYNDIYIMGLQQMSLNNLVRLPEFYESRPVATANADIFIPVIAASGQGILSPFDTAELRQRSEAAINGLMTDDMKEFVELRREQREMIAELKRVDIRREHQVEKGNKQRITKKKNKQGGKRRRTRKKKRKRHKKKKTRKKKGGMPILSTFSRGAIAALALFQDPAGNYIHPKGDKTVPQYSLNSTHTGIKGNMKALSQQQLAMAKKYSNELAKYDKEQMSYSQAQWFHTMTGDQAAAINVAAEASRQPKPEKPKFAVEVGDVDPQIAKKYGWTT